MVINLVVEEIGIGGVGHTTEEAEGHREGPDHMIVGMIRVVVIAMMEEVAEVVEVVEVVKVEVIVAEIELKVAEKMTVTHRAQARVQGL